MRTAINILSLLTVTVALAAGQLLFKRAAIGLHGRPLSSITMLFADPSFYLALVVYGTATLLWIWVLSRIPLSQAYPWVAASVIIVPLLAWQFFGERVAPMFWVGLVLMVVGLILTQVAASEG